ncbi:MAG: peptidoglycan-binding domain-containing protein [Candidatus Acidiferrales bacterium]
MRRVSNSCFLLSLAATALLLFGALGPLAKSTSGQSSSSSTAHKKKKSSHHRSHREPFQKAPTPDRITEIQSALAREGFYQGDTNGKWDSNTVSALQKFQSANNLEASGKLDAGSLQKLGLGSSIAGLNPPTPPKRSSPLGNSSNAPSKTQSPGPVNSASNSAPATPR